MPDPTDLQALAVEVLDACVEALDTIPTYDATLDGAPDRAFVSPGRPAFEDCSQLTVYMEPVLVADTTPGGLGAGRRTYARITHVSLVITAVRCVVDTRNTSMQGQLEPFKASDLQAVAAQTNADAWALWNHLYNLWTADMLFTLCGEVFFDGMRPVPEEGGRAGWQLVIRVSFDGYPETIGT